MHKAAITALLLSCTVPAFAKTHKFNYAQPCNTLWPAVKDALRNSGKYGIIGIDNEEKTASYNIGGFLTGKRINSVLLNVIPSGCEMQVQSSYSGAFNNDVDDFKKRVDESLAKLSAPSGPSKTDTPEPNQPAAPAADKPKTSPQ